MELPRLLIAAPSSGGGKTMITCGILKAMINRGMKTTAFKCGPDFIDPMFHTKIVGSPSKNLDTFFCDEKTVKYLFGKTAIEGEISIIEGVMGYYDGVAGISEWASAYDVAKTLDSPVILVINAKGMSLSVAAIIKGFLTFRSDHNIKGVILNQVSPMMYQELKKLIEEELSIPVFGYLPYIKDAVIESRHLGLITPDEIVGLKEKVYKLASILEETLDIDGLIELANMASPFSYENLGVHTFSKEVHLGVAYDEAFCFYYQDNLDLLQSFGANIHYFSPLHDKELPKNLDGLLIGGGYPELYAKELSQNLSMKKEIKEAIDHHMPCLAECGGFMYLHKSMEDMEHNSWDMVGTIDGKVYKKDKLGRFGYITLTDKQTGERIKGHEFHYFDSTDCGEDYEAKKPLRNRLWNCIHKRDTLMAGFPHLYYYANPDFVRKFVDQCSEYRKGKA